MDCENNKKSSVFEISTISGKFELNHSLTKTPSRRCCFRQRHIITVFAFLTCFTMCTSRLVLGVGIVAMVKHRNNVENTSQNKTELSCPLSSSSANSTTVENLHGEFDWSPELQGYVLGSSFLSLLITQVPAGRFADAIGSKPLVVAANAASGFFTLISPFAARWHVYALIAIQFLRGGSQGFTLPAVYKMLSNWIPKNERGTLSTLVVCGFATGISLGGIATGWLCDIPGLGWPSAFYISGALSIALGIAIQFICYEFPAENPWITDEELKYIIDGLENKSAEKHPPTPWKKIFTSVPCYAYYYGLFGHYWSITYFLTVHPTFMGTILHYPMTANGVTSCLPVLMKSVGGVTASIMCHWITKKNLITINKLRKLTTGFGAFGFSLCMAGILLARCNAIINILCFTLSLYATGIALSGVMISGVDMAPTFAAALGKDIQDAYNIWQSMTPSYKWDMNMHMQRDLKNANLRELYCSLIQGFEIWDHAQNRDGAPGWRIKESSVNEVIKHIGEDLLTLLHTLEGAMINSKKKGPKIIKTIALKSSDSYARILTKTGKGDKNVEKEDNAVFETKIQNSVGMDLEELPDCLPPLSNTEKVEKFRKDHFKLEFEDSRNQCLDESLFDSSEVVDDFQDDRNEPIIPTVSKIIDSLDVSLEENAHLQNLRLSDFRDDSDFEKQISPLISDDEV